jgi:hypothetical protein
MFSTHGFDEENWKSEARYSMENGTYCVICGGNFELEGGGVCNIDPKEPRYQVRTRRIALDLTDSQTVAL